MIGEIAKDRGTRAEYARHIGRSRQLISRWVDEGKIPVEPDGKTIIFARADHALKRNVDPSRALANQSAKQAVGQTETAKQAQSTDADLFDIPDPQEVKPKSDDQGPDYQEHRALRESYNAELARLELEEKKGELVSRREIEDAMVSAGRRIRQGLDAVASWADELDAAARNGGTNAVRSVLKDKMRGLQDLIADSLVSMQDDTVGEDDS